MTGKPGTAQKLLGVARHRLRRPRPEGWRADACEFTPAQRKAVVRSMNAYVRKHQRFALTGGQGGKRLYLYEPDDLSAMWARLQVASRDLITRAEAKNRLQEATREAIEAGLE